MSPEQRDPREYENYVENLLFNHDIIILSQFVKAMSFEKKEDYAYFTEDDFKGKTDFSLNIEIESKQRDENQVLVSLIVNLEAKINQKTAIFDTIFETLIFCSLFVL